MYCQSVTLIEYNIAEDNKGGGEDEKVGEDGDGGKNEEGRQDEGRGEDGEDREKTEDTACLRCHSTYKIYKIEKFVSQKCNHHFCGNCIKHWRNGWEGDVNLFPRQPVDGPNITTKECLYESCNVHHDKLGGGQDSRGAEQSYVMDKRTVCSLLIKSIERDYVYKRHLQIH